MYLDNCKHKTGIDPYATRATPWTL